MCAGLQKNRPANRCEKVTGHSSAKDGGSTCSAADLLAKRDAAEAVAAGELSGGAGGV